MKVCEMCGYEFGYEDDGYKINGELHCKECASETFNEIFEGLDIEFKVAIMDNYKLAGIMDVQSDEADEEDYNDAKKDI